MIGLFFPQRIALRINGGSYSPLVLTKAVVAAAHVPSYPVGAKLLDVVGGISLSSLSAHGFEATLRHAFFASAPIFPARPHDVVQTEFAIGFSTQFEIQRCRN